MKPKIVILSDVEGWVVASATIDGKEYWVKLNTIGMPTDKRNELIREMAKKKAEGE